ncbi:hypothetical protein SUDANB174_05042 [Streptomyces sp. enrichment culture]
MGEWRRVARGVPVVASPRLRGAVAEPGREPYGDLPYVLVDRLGAVVDPGREPYGDLPYALADRLGAVVVDGRNGSGAEAAGG